jgi:pyruvate/2-oxoglutarate dehydrogenase complex dihydrolipoamide acyltransferase (E2) component
MIAEGKRPIANPKKEAARQAGYQVTPFSMERRLVAAVAAEGRRQNNIHGFTEVDVSRPRRLIQNHFEQTGEKLSFTAYLMTCLGRTVAEYPEFNSFRKGRKLIVLDDVTISSQIERVIDGVRTPEPIGIRRAQDKTCRQITREIREAQRQPAEEFGGLSGAGWLRFLPSFLFRTFIRFASQNVGMMARYGAVGVTAVGMYGPRNQASWLLPLVGGATVAVAVGGIVERPVLVEGEFENHEHVCLTISFNHDIVDGAPAARFTGTFSEMLKSGTLVLEGDEGDHLAEASIGAG